jgi:hypothetical protein
MGLATPAMKFSQFILAIISSKGKLFIMKRERVAVKP